ncbi:hypothetical protein PHYPSEUDO_006010 [Phytophthora pseudosyringae]|uniref:SCP domain-containing protein n=1 Tax=Phytophthora pseudosyringae TaxID=221518 RepID=A0A8T1VMZ3_9STRA|nr:hypothetical protein PHYPSEUDO_006010 [Phytophthora pseudosyringae]
MTISKTSSVLLLLVAAASTGASEAANLRNVQRSLAASYTQSSEFLSEMLARVNKERHAEGLPPVCGNKKLLSSSQRHSDDMAKNNYMEHTGTDGSTMPERITDAGYDWSAVGENVAAGQEDVQAVMDAWMHSPEHRENIMGDYAMLGATYAYNRNTEFKHFWTQDFGKSETEGCDPASDSQDQNPDQEQVAQNEDQVQGEADTEETPVPKTAVHATEAPEEKTLGEAEPGKVQGATDASETPCPKKEQTPAPMQETTQRSAEKPASPASVNAVKDCNPKF